MGNIMPREQILDQRIEDTEGRLYWPSPPFEGPIKLRFICSNCKEESLVLSPYPQYWRDLANLKGECFLCAKVTDVHAKFLEAGKKREAIWIYKGHDLGPQLVKFIRAGPPVHGSMEEMMDSAELHYTRSVHPPNFRDTSALGADFQYTTQIAQSEGGAFQQKHRIFIRTVKQKLKTWDRWKVTINRADNILEQACKAFIEASPSKLRGNFKIKFVDEDAYDLGGVTREFFHLVSTQMLDPSNNLFLPNGPNNTFHPSPTSGINDNHLAYYRFFGRFLGKALIEQRLVKAPFTRAIWKLLLGKSLSFTDFQTVDKMTYNRLRETLTYDEETLEACGFVFAANIEDFGAGRMYPLKEGGDDINVTSENLHEWIAKYSAWKMIDSVYEQLNSLLLGFYDVVPVQALSIFNELELEQVLCGISEVDVEDWKQHTVTVGVHQKDEQVEWFWEMLRQFSNEERGLVIQFTTGSAQVPLSFEYFNPPFTVGFNTGGLSKDSLPYSHTCFNRLDLPTYSSPDKMAQQVLKVLELGAVGFGIK